VFRSDPVLAEGLLLREVQDPVGPRGEAQRVVLRRQFGRADDVVHVADGRDAVNADRGQRCGVRLRQAEQEVFGADVVVVERTGLVGGAVEDLAHAVGELHAASLRAGPAGGMGDHPETGPERAITGRHPRRIAHGVTP